MSRLVFVLLTSLLFGPHAVANQACMSRIKKIFQPKRDVINPEQLFSTAETALKRQLTDLQKKALLQAQKITPLDVYTAGELAKQNRVLAKAKFSSSEVNQLRQQGILINSVLKLSKGAPDGVEIRSLALKKMGPEELKKISIDRAPVNYIVTQDGRMLVTHEPLNFSSDKIIAVTNKTDDELASRVGSIVVREAGEVIFDPQTKGYIFKSQYGLDSSSLEVEDLIKSVNELVPKAPVSYKANPSISQSQIVKCLDILSAQSSGKNFVLDRMITDNLVTTTAIMGTELMGAGRLSTREGQAVVAADIIGGNITGLIGAKIGKQLVVKDSNFVTSMAIRTGLGLSMIEAQKYMTKGALAVTESDEEITSNPDQTDTAEAIAAFNRAHFFIRLPVNHYFDKFMVNKLPNLIFNTCQSKPGMSVLVSPRSIRLYERYASSILYYGARSAIIGQ